MPKYHRKLFFVDSLSQKVLTLIKIGFLFNPYDHLVLLGMWSVRNKELSSTFNSYNFCAMESLLSP